MRFNTPTDVSETTTAAQVKPRLKTDLTDAEIRGLAAKDKAYKVSDRHGMYWGFP